MIHFIFTAFIFSFLISTQAVAGFEWLPPMKNPAQLPQQDTAPVENAMPSMGTGISSEVGFPAPKVLSEPLTNNASANKMPIPILPQQQISQPVKIKNLSGKKLIINPYPLRNNSSLQPPENKLSMSEIYKAMNEESGKLHPVKLGNGMTTGAKKKSTPVAKAVRIASTAHKTFLTPTENGMTPMVGKELASLPSADVPRGPIERVSLSTNYAEAIGFGRDLPLALALSQVIPAEFTHSFAKNVDAGVNVSWEGGKPWDQVLNDMLSPNNLTATIQSNKVIIQPMARL